MKTILSILLIAGSFSLYSQEETAAGDSLVAYQSLLAQARSFGDSVVIRWAPETASAWQKTNYYGYKVSRADITEGADSFAYVTLADTIKPMSLLSWQSGMSPTADADYAAIAMQCIYGETGSEIPLHLNTFKLKRDLLNSRFGFTLFAADVDRKAADYSGLRFVDYQVEEGREYLYKISHLVPDSILTMAPTLQYVATDSLYLPKPLQIQKSEDENVITLLWDRETAKQDFTAYFIERSKDGRDYEPLHKVPYIQGYDKQRTFYNSTYTYTDSIGANYDPFFYRVAGITMFGNRSDWSKPIKAQGVDKTPPNAATGVTASLANKNTAVISWTNNSDAREVKKTNVYYSFDQENGYFNLTPGGLAADVDNYEHKDVNIYLKHFYKIETIDTAGNSAFSAPYRMLIRDTFPPSMPTGLSGRIDTNGIVTLTWNLNPELDLMGYKIFYANEEGHEFSLVTGHAVADTAYRDSITLKTYTRNIYYKVIALDQSFNYSDHSATLKLVRPDILPPSSPIINDYEVRDNGIYIAWARSESEDLERHELARRNDGDDWELVATFYDETNEYLDTLMSPNTTYDYKVVAVDSSGLHSMVIRPVRLKSHKSKIPPIYNFNVSVDNKTGQANLTWLHEFSSDIKFVIYKEIDDSGYNLLKVNNASKTDLFDKNIQKGKSYNYAVKVMHEDGRKSKFSRVVSINL